MQSPCHFHNLQTSILSKLLHSLVRVKVKPLFNLGAARAGLLPGKQAFLTSKAALLLHPDDPSSSLQRPVSARAQRACNVCSDAPDLCACLPRPEPEPCYLLWLRVLRLLLLRARRTWKGIPGPLRPGRPPRLGDHERCRVARDWQQAAQVCCADRHATPCPTSDRHVLPWSPPPAGSFLTWPAWCVLREAGEGLALLAEQALPARVAGARASSSNHVITEQKRRDRINKGCAAAALTSCRWREGTRRPRAAKTGAPGARSFDELRTLIQGEVKLDKAAFLSAVVQYIKQVQVRTCPQSARLCTCAALCMTSVACLGI